MSTNSTELLQPTFRLTSGAARTVLAAAEKEASAHDWNVTIAIVDAGGIPVLVQRADGAFAASYEIAVGKAQTAAHFSKPTAPLEALTNTRRAALLSAPFVLMQGGVPIICEWSLLRSGGCEWSETKRG